MPEDSHTDDIKETSANIKTEISVSNTFDDRLKKAFDFSADSTKQLITVSVGIIAFTITFSKDFVGGVSGSFKIIAVISWVCYFISVFFGLVTLNSLTGQLEPGDDSAQKPSIWHPAVNRPMFYQWITFMLGLILTLIYGCIAVFNQAQPTNDLKFTFPNSIINIIPADSSQNRKDSLLHDSKIHSKDDSRQENFNDTDKQYSLEKALSLVSSLKESTNIEIKGEQIILNYSYSVDGMNNSEEFLFSLKDSTLVIDPLIRHLESNKESIKTYMTMLKKYSK